MNATLARKLAHVVSLRTDDNEVRAAIRNLDGFYGENSMESRRQLRGKIEEQQLSVNARFLASFQAVSEALGSVQRDVDGLASCCDDITERLESARAATRHLTEETERLSRAQTRSERRIRVVEAFTERFELSEDDMHALRVAPVGERFFLALDRVGEIQVRAKDLLRTEHQRLGLEAMDKMNLHLEQAYERLYAFVQQEFVSLYEDQPEVTPLLRLAVRALRARPLLFTDWNEVVNARRTAVLRKFVAALTTGGPHGTPRPIELHAHDPLRYVGDMLAWLHQAVASEVDLLQGLFGKREEGDVSPGGDVLSGGEEEDTAAAAAAGAPNELAMLDEIFEAVCRPFHMRVEQVVNAERNVVVAYRLCSLLEFYYATVGDLLERTAKLPQTFREVHVLAISGFMRALRAMADDLVRHVSGAPADLSPPAAVYETSNKLREIMTVYETSLVAKESDDRARDFKPVLDLVVRAVLDSCQLTASDLVASDMAVLMINSIGVLLGALAGRDFAASQTERLEAEVDAHLDTLIEEQSSVFLVHCGMTDKLLTLRALGDDTAALGSVAGLHADDLRVAAKAFYAALLGGDRGAMVIPAVDRLSKPELRRRSLDAISRRVLLAYGELYDAVAAAADSYGEPVTAVLQHDVAQLKVLLGLDE